MKRTLLTIGSAILLQLSAHAQFNGAYDPTNWSITTSTGTASVNSGSAPSSIQFTATGNLSSGYSYLDYSITAPQSGTLSFDWSVNDPSGNGEVDIQTNGGVGTYVPFYMGGGPTSGTQSISVSAGDVVELLPIMWSNNSGHIITVTLSNFSAPGNNPLPIKLKSFTGIASNKGNRLDWETAMESDVANYSIERSMDGKAYNAIGTVEAKNAPGTYSFTDIKMDGTAYYRLRVNNINGIADYSNVISLRNKSSELNLQAYPNPATDAVTIRTNTAGAEATVSLIDITGKVLDVQSIVSNTATFNLKAQPAGIYVVRFNDGAEVKTMRIVKQ